MTMPGRTLAAAAMVLVLAGCSDAGGDPAAGTPGMDPMAEMAPTVDTVPFQTRLRAATIAHDGLRSLGGPGKPETETNQTFVLSDVCAHHITFGPDYRGDHQSFDRSWSWPGWWVATTTHGWTAQNGAAMIAAVRAAAIECMEFTDTDGNVVDMIEAVGLPGQAGIDDRYAQCERHTADGQWWTLCRAFLARGNYVTEVRVSRVDRKSSQQGLAQVAPLAAAALAAVT
jgi:hypothetical protein